MIYQNMNKLKKQFKKKFKFNKKNKNQNIKISLIKKYQIKYS